MAKVSEPLSARQQRQLPYISEFFTDIQHVAGKTNLVTDCFSPAIVGAVQIWLDYTHMAADQSTDPDVQSIRTAAIGLQLT